MISAIENAPPAGPKSLLPEKELALLYSLGERWKLALIAGNLEQAHELTDAAPAVLNPEADYDERDPGSAPLPVVITDEKICNIVWDGTPARDAATFCQVSPAMLRALAGVGQRVYDQLIELQIAWRRKIAAAQEN